MLTISNLGVTFTQYEQGLRRKQLTVITDLDLTVQAGEVVAVVGAPGPKPSNTSPGAAVSAFRRTPAFGA